MKLKVQFINAFTDVLFKGNSAAVIVVDNWLSKDVMQFIATENNLSETAFLKPQALGTYEIRWFSPITEIDFCGHATLAASSHQLRLCRSTLCLIWETRTKPPMPHWPSRITRSGVVHLRVTSLAMWTSCVRYWETFPLICCA